MIAFPNAKINIGLNVIEKRPDGFHNIESVFYPVNWCDVLEVIENEGSTGIELITTGIPISGIKEENLIVRAYNLVSRNYEVPPVKVHLHKIIPMGAGLGGGSSDAAFFIKLLNEKFDLNISWGEMHHYARQLGSDCSFFITNQAVFAEQKGDAYERIGLNLSGYFIAIVYPGIFISTPEAYKNITPQKSSVSIEDMVLKLPVEEWKKNVRNDFEKFVFNKYPEIKDIKNKLYENGAVYASMSGSGSSVYGIFKTLQPLKMEFPNYSVWEGKLL